MARNLDDWTLAGIYTRMTSEGFDKETAIELELNMAGIHVDTQLTAEDEAFLASFRG